MKSVSDQPSGNLPFLKPDDIQYFDKLLVSVLAAAKCCSWSGYRPLASSASQLLQVDVDESTLSPEEQKERKIMKLLLKIKNGTPPMRKVSSIFIS